jgi:hypothetical protein
VLGHVTVDILCQRPWDTGFNLAMHVTMRRTVATFCNHMLRPRLHVRPHSDRVARVVLASRSANTAHVSVAPQGVTADAAAGTGSGAGVPLSVASASVAGDGAAVRVRGTGHGGVVRATPAAPPARDELQFTTYAHTHKGRRTEAWFAANVDVGDVPEIVSALKVRLADARCKRRVAHSIDTLAASVPLCRPPCRRGSSSVVSTTCCASAPRRSTE